MRSKISKKLKRRLRDLKLITEIRDDLFLGFIKETGESITELMQETGEDLIAETSNRLERRYEKFLQS